MATRKKSSKRSVRSAATDVVAGGERIREGVRDLVVGAFDGATTTADALGKVVHEVLDGVTAAVKDAIPRDRESPLREVVSGLTEAATVMAESGRKSVAHAAKTSRKAVVGGGATLRDSALRSTHEMLAAVESFASTVAGSTRKELEHLVAEARTTGGRLAAPTERAASAATKHPATLAKETVESGTRFALGTTSRLMTAAGGMLSGLGAGLAQSGRAASPASGGTKAKAGGSKGARGASGGKADGSRGPDHAKGRTGGAKNVKSTARRSKKV